ncbi:DUF3450 family protein [Photobacterium nomapromontoriensis]|uniref:DUF3450 family protein n=1 Tax=Photobacterium nomapromontoriensis TaxID=2910237 RepID=UPI003D0F5E77
MRLVIFVLSLCFSLLSRADTLAHTDQLTAEKMAREKARIALQQQWQQEQADLQQLLNRYVIETKALKNKLDDFQHNQNEQKDKRSALLTQQSLLENKAHEYEQLLLVGTNILQPLWLSFPPAIVRMEQVNYVLLSDPKADLNQRVTALIDLLTALDQFNRVMTFEKQRIALSGQEWQVEVLYLGLAQAYFRSADGSQVGLGYAMPQNVGQGWQWQLIPEQQKAINQAFAIYLQQQKNQILSLPVREIVQ